MRLRRAQVVDVAIELLDADGLDALTMRKLATRLGVQPGALYWHFAGKQALLDAMADRFLEGFTAGRPAGPWDEQFAVLGWRLRQVLLSHRDGARVMAGTYVAEPNTILLGNVAIEILQDAGLAPERAGWATFAAFHFILGHTIEEQAQLELTKRGAWEPKLTVDGIENKLAATAFTADPAERFGYGLELFLDGIRRQLT
ncbi:MAG TPA: TetR/AcrR family transcriptional regulator C-terminal domain-containing protein [Streptosporangiaceae bacterium]|nr:TetR/AcrR family transcriptional regulator C-terminal domain-containing protein [Streptosporangiaceae bacterium]